MSFKIYSMKFECMLRTVLMHFNGAMHVCTSALWNVTAKVLPFFTGKRLSCIFCIMEINQSMNDISSNLACDWDSYSGNACIYLWWQSPQYCSVRQWRSLTSKRRCRRVCHPEIKRSASNSRSQHSRSQTNGVLPVRRVQQLILASLELQMAS